MWVQFEPGRVHVAVNVSVREIAVAQNLAAQDDNFDNAALAAAAEKHRDYVLQHLKFRAEGRALDGRVLQITGPPIFSEPEKTYYQYELEFPYAGPAPAKITVTQDMLREWPLRTRHAVGRQLHRPVEALGFR